MAEEESKQHKKRPYDKPTATQLTREQAKLKLMRHAMVGSKDAKTFLDILFQQESPTTKKQPYDKPRATRLTREEARMRLTKQALTGNKDATQLLDMLFDNENKDNDGEEEKKSA